MISWSWHDEYTRGEAGALVYHKDIDRVPYDLTSLVNKLKVSGAFRWSPIFNGHVQGRKNTPAMLLQILEDIQWFFEVGMNPSSIYILVFIDH